MCTVYTSIPVSILKYNFTVCFNIFNDKFINLCTEHTADQGKYTCMSTRAYVGTIRNIVYHIITINRGYPFTHTHSISVVGDFWFTIKWRSYLLRLPLPHILVLSMSCCSGFGIKMWELEQ